jgi:hypothetical protein
MNIMIEDIRTTLEAIKPGRLKNGLQRMLFIMLQDIEHGIDEEFSSEFFSDLQSLFDLLSELKRLRKQAKRNKE